MKRIFGCSRSGLVTIAASAQWSNPAADIPAYNASRADQSPSRPSSAATNSPGEYFTHPYQVTAYKMAAKIPKVLHQQPCYCHCDRAMGHNSLHSCFEGTHGATCSDLHERSRLLPTSRQRTARHRQQIRAGIERGEWQDVDLEKAAL